MNDHTQTDAERRFQRRGRITAIALMGIVAGPMLVAYILFQTGIGIPDSQVNQGQLLDPPQHFSDWQPKSLDGEAWTSDPEQKRWRFVVPIDAGCTGQCKANLYLTRQVHVRLADKAYRVKRVILPVNGMPSEDLLDALREEHPGTEIVHPDQSAMMTSLEKTNLPGDPVAEGRYFLMDQEGFVMMAYGPDHTGNQLLKDIKRLLRYSYED